MGIYSLLNRVPSVVTHDSVFNLYKNSERTIHTEVITISRLGFLGDLFPKVIFSKKNVLSEDLMKRFRKIAKQISRVDKHDFIQLTVTKDGFVQKVEYYEHDNGSISTPAHLYKPLEEIKEDVDVIFPNTTFKGGEGVALFPIIDQLQDTFPEEDMFYVEQVNGDKIVSQYFLKTD